MREVKNDEICLTIFIGAFEVEDEATEFVRCKIESLYANKVDPFKEGRFPAGPGATEFVRC